MAARWLLLIIHIPEAASQGPGIGGIRRTASTTRSARAVLLPYQGHLLLEVEVGHKRVLILPSLSAGPWRQRPPLFRCILLSCINLRTLEDGDPSLRGLFLGAPCT